MELRPETILAAYRRGVFPMGDPDTDTVDWYLPVRRAVVPLKDFHCPRRLARTVRAGKFELASDRDFEGVIDACADRDSTWITPPIRKAYVTLNGMNWAHSVEAWRDGKLVGGLYGVHIGGAFMAESMFHRETDAGKVCLVKLVEFMKKNGFRVLDIQMVTPLLERFGAVEVTAKEYQRRLERAFKVEAKWRWTPTAVSRS